MATYLKSANFTGSNGSHFYIQLYYDLSQDVPTNTSTITYYLYVGSSDGYSGSGSSYCNGYINGNWVGSFNSIGVNAYFLVGQRQESIVHNNDGTKTVSYSASVTSNWSYLGNASLSGDLTLPKINRYPVLNSGSDFTDEGNPVYNITAYNTFPIRIKLEAGGNTQLITRDLTTQGSTTYTLILTQPERNLLRQLTPNNNELTVTETVCAMSGNTELSVSYKQYKMTIVNANPVFSNFEFEDINPTTLALTGDSSININGYSNTRVTISTSNKAEAQKYATMNKYRYTNGTASIDIPYSSNSSVSGIINGTQSGTHNIFAIDSRNNTPPAVTKLSSEEIAYEKVYINKQSSSIVRNSNQVGENAILTLNGTFWNDSFGSVTNTLKSVTYRFKKTSDTTWIIGTTTITPTTNQNDFSFTGQIASNNQDTTWDLDSSYNIEITVGDELSSATVDFILNSAVPTLSLDKQGVGIMKAYDTTLGGGLQVNDDIYISNGGNDISVFDSLIEKYSTNEEVIGEWTNGKPLYRMVIDYSISSSASQTITISTGVSDIDVVTKASGTGLFGNLWLPLTFYNADGWNSFHISKSGNLIYQRGSNYYCSRINVIFEYTKTTD